MDFTPDFDASSVKVSAYAHNLNDAPFESMDTNACNYMTCPIVKDQKSTYNYFVPIEAKHPPGVYDVKWVMTVDDQPKCCFINKLKIDKKKKN